LARKVAVEATLEAARYLASAAAVEKSTAAMDREMGQLDRAIDAVDRDLTELATVSVIAGKGVDDLGDNARGTAGELRLLDARIDASKKKVRELGLEFARTGEAVDGTALGRERSFLGKLQRLRKELGDLTEAPAVAVGAGIGSAIPGGGGAAGMGGHGALIGGIVALVALAAPAIGAVIAGAVVGAVGVGGVVGGVVAAAQDPRVKKAWEDMTGGLSFKTFGGDQLADPVVNAIGILGQGLQDLNLDELLGKAGPGIENLAKGVVDLATNAMPGLNKVMDNLDEITDVVAAGLGNMGDAFSDMLIDMLDSEGTLEGLQAIFDILSGSMRALGEITRVLGDTFHFAGRLSANFSGALEDVFHWAQVLTPALYPIEQLMKSINDTTENLTGGSGEVSTQFEMMSTTSAHLNERLQDTAGALAEVDKKAINATASLTKFYDMQMGIIDANIAFEQGLDDLADSLKENGTSLDINGQKGRDNMTAIQTALKDAAKARDELAATGKVEEANAAYKRMVDRLRDVLKQAGFTKAEIDKLVKPYEFTITAHLVVKGSIPKYVSSSLSEPAQDAAHRAGGGDLMPGRPYIYGEHGPELGFFGAQGRMLSNSDSRAWAGGTGGGSVDARPVVFTFPAGSMENALIETINTAVQARGGRLAVLGLKG